MPTPGQMMVAALKNIPERTGRSVEEWIALIKASGLQDARDRRAWLKVEHGLKQNTQWALVWATERAEGRREPTGEELVDAQYSGAKAALRETYECLASAVLELGDDVELSPRTTYVSVIRGYQFAIIQPSTSTRIDLGLRLPGTQPAGRLEAAGSFGSGSTSHRVRVSSAAEVDGALLAWLRSAYELRG